MSIRTFAERALEQGQGILRLTPTWVPRVFCIPGRRIKLHPDDYYALGAERGGIDERWFASTTPADNGPKTGLHEGLSFIVFEDGEDHEQQLLRDVIDEMGAEILGPALWQAHGSWPMYSKFFDNQGPLPHHIHHRDEHVASLGLRGKPESYYFPPQVNNHGGDFPFTFFGISPGVERSEIRRALENFTNGDNKITNLSRCFRLEIGTGWDVPPGLLHAPGSLCTYEPQVASDVYAMFQSVVNGQVLDEALLWKDTPHDKVGDFDYLMELIDWELNTDPGIYSSRFMTPLPAGDLVEMRELGYEEHWIVYKSSHYSAKELTIFPGTTVTIRDSAPYGFIMMQGHGSFGPWPIEAPALIRYGQLTYDEFFVTEQAAREGIMVTNSSRSDPLVMLKHFGPNNPDLKL